MERGNVVRFHLLNRYSDGPDMPLVEGTPVEIRITQTLEVEVDPQHDLFWYFREAVANDPAIRSAVKDAVPGGSYHFAPLPDGVTAENWHNAEEFYGSIRWEIDSFWGTVRRVDRTPVRLSLDELEELVREGYATGNPRELLVIFDWGLGGGESFYDIATWLLEHGVDIGVSFLAERGLSAIWERVSRRIRGSARDRRARRLAALWEGNNFFKPSHLRDYIDNRREWDVAEVAKRLALAESSAGRLLRALGYEANRAGVWHRSTRWGPERRRRGWIRDEENVTGFGEFRREA